jgi:predicted nucleic acid-binding protein
MKLVIDASVAIKWYLPEDHTDAALTVVSEDITIHAPELLISEFGNTLWKKIRRGDLEIDKAQTIAAAMLRRRISYHPLRPLLSGSLAEASTTSIPVYDWMYIVLARSLGCKFVTADRRFFLAARSSTLKRSVMWVEELL